MHNFCDFLKNIFLVTAVALSSPACLVFFSSTLLIFDTTSATSVLTFPKERDHPDVQLSPPLKLHLPADMSVEKNPAERCRIYLFYSLFYFWTWLSRWVSQNLGCCDAAHDKWARRPEDPCRTNPRLALGLPWWADLVSADPLSAESGLFPLGLAVRYSMFTSYH